MGRRSFSRVAVTRRMTKDLEASYDDVVAAAMLYAEIADDEENTRPADRIKAGIAWQEAIHALGARIADEARVVSWAESRPRAV